MSSVVTRDGAVEGPPGSSGTGAGRAQLASRPGDRAGNFAFLLLLGVPIALVVVIAWQFLMQTSAELNGTERIGGWSAVLRDLPAVLLVFVPVVAGLTLGVRSARLGSRRGIVAIWLHSLVVFLVLLGRATSADTVAAKVAGVLLLAAGIAVLLLLCLRVAHARPPDAGLAGPPARHLRLAAVLPIAGIAVAMMWLAAAQVALSAHADGFVRASVPKSGDVHVITVPVDHAGTYYVYVEGGAVSTLDELGAQVTDPIGRAVPVQALTPRPEYLHDWRGGYAVGTFEATLVGDYRVAATGTLPPVLAPYAPPNPYGNFAVGDSVATWMQPHEWGAAALLFVTLGSSIVLAAVTAIRRRRPRRRQQVVRSESAARGLPSELS